jgi:multidrug efflux system outer membrane protein
VVGAYYTLLDFQQRRRIAVETLNSRMESLYIIEQRFEKGIIHELDLNQAQIQKEIAAAAIPLYERAIVKTEIALSILLGQLPMGIETGKDLNLQTAPPGIPTGLPSKIIERRPDVVLAEHLVHAQTARIGVAVALRFPAISLTGVLGAASTEVGMLTSEGGAWSVGAGLLGPIFNYNKNVRLVEIEEARTQEVLYRYENTVLTAFREVNDALVEIQTFREQLSAVRSQQKAARNANKLSKERYDKGVSSYLEVLETERSLFNVELQFSELQQQYLNAYVNLYKALGGGWITKAEMEATLTAQPTPPGNLEELEEVEEVGEVEEVEKGGTYRIRAQGRLGEEGRDRLNGMAVSQDDSVDPPVTTLEGNLADQAALANFLRTLYELNLTLLSVERLEEKQ